MIGIVDYGLGNVRAFENIYRRLGIAAQPVRTAEQLSKAERLILPGVGAFDWSMAKLIESGMIDALNARVLQDGVPVLGVCVGMQIMAEGSDEGTAMGLGWIPGRVKRFRDECFNTHTHLPHMGWNDIEVVGTPALFGGLTEPRFYFLHSYFFVPADDDHVIARTSYGQVFASAVRRENIWATQFHPEKSHDWGVGLLRNFAKV